VTTPQIRSNNRWRGRGAPALQVDPVLIQYLEASYREDTCIELPADPEDQDTKDLIRMIKVYANRQRKSAQVQFFEEDGASHLRFRMRDKRPYVRKGNGQ